MKIGVISDTHIPIFSRGLSRKICDGFRGCDVIIHAGDLVEMSVLAELSSIAETKAVCGNMDEYEVRQKLPEKIVFTAGGKRIGVVHGKGPSSRIMPTVKGMFKEKLDILVFGHSHVPCSEEIDGVLYFNPGSASGENGTFGIIEINDGNVRTRIVRIA